MSFAHLTPEQRRAAQQKSAATRKANRDASKKRLAGMNNVMLEPDAEETLDRLASLDVAEPLILKTPEPEDAWIEGILTDAEKEELRAAAQKKAREDKHKAARAAYAKEQLEIARRDLGSVPADEEFRTLMQEEVRIYIDMPRMRKPTGGEQDPEPIIIDQVAYSSGRYYSVDRGKAIYIQHLMDQARRHVNQIDGRSRTYYNAGIGQMIYQGGPAIGGGSLGTSFDALHKRSA
jgi:hypothetical protein